jgi:radical SAM protein with 4Fe4S-binding SPASM domain
MNYQETLYQLQQRYDVVGEIDLDIWNHDDYEGSQTWLESRCRELYRDFYAEEQRLVFKLINGDAYVGNENTGLIIRNLQIILNELNISNFFVVLISSNPNIEQELVYIKNISSDAFPITGLRCQGDWRIHRLDRYPISDREHYKYGSLNPIKISLNDISAREKFLLTESKTFCMYPWVHLHVWPNGQAYPCCHAEFHGQIGDCKSQSMSKIWNSANMKELRISMLEEKPHPTCKRCYEQEKSGFFSGRRSANKHHGHHIGRVAETTTDGQFDRFEMTYWDVRFSNLCNLKCRSCGFYFSSSWYQDQVKIAGPKWKATNNVLNYAGRTETDIWEQLEPHLDYVEQIYFAGGEPLIMDEHYRILDELEQRKRFDVRLIYNTNFTQVHLRDRSVFDYWKKFHSVSVGASLDGMGAQAEYIRKGTRWADVETNRRNMIEICPNVDFYVSATLSIMNAWHIIDFHRSWADQGLIKPQDFNINILQDPHYYRIDIAPMDYKQKLENRYREHLEWLKPQDHLNRATVGFESAITFMTSIDNTASIEDFWKRTHQLDSIRDENILDVLPELKALQ